VEPITGVVTGVLFLGEKMSVGMIIGSVIVVIASILIAVFDAKKSN
jgi:drug/metabolite transporter (DMT)-like permease